MSEQNLTAPETAKIGRKSKSEEPEEIPIATTTTNTTRTAGSVAEASPKRRKVESAIAKLNRSVASTSHWKPLVRKEKSDSRADDSRLESSTGCSEEESSGGGLKSVDPAADWYLKSENSSVVSSPESEVCAELPEKEIEMKSKSRANIQRRSVVFEAPTAEEIEDFFSAAEKIEAQRFKDKYNFDIVNDVPVKGRFEWSRVKH